MAAAVAAALAAPSSSSVPIPVSQISLLKREVMGIGGGGGGRRTSVSTTFRSSAVSAPVIESQIPNCLSETHLHQTVPGLGLSSTGKVISMYVCVCVSKRHHIWS